VNGNSYDMVTPSKKHVIGLFCTRQSGWSVFVLNHRPTKMQAIRAGQVGLFADQFLSQLLPTTAIFATQCPKF
jgi:hypothetical protein